ncbi:hypothetical protein ACIRBX_25115 [Kitasatospora sp. NPDC096147]|uniref:hypothetical protein n=1 Tax=Kitasatospora sp. NPDC096147 TaxID=3364093 RepID=UPI003809F690
MNDRPTPDQLDHLLGHADTRRLTAAEAIRLRTGVLHLREQAAAAQAWARHWHHQSTQPRTPRLDPLCRCAPDCPANTLPSL